MPCDIRAKSTSTPNFTLSFNIDFKPLLVITVITTLPDLAPTCNPTLIPPIEKKKGPENLLLPLLMINKPLPPLAPKINPPS